MGAAVFARSARPRGRGRGPGPRRPRSRRRARRTSSSIQSWRFTRPMSRTPPGCGKSAAGPSGIGRSPQVGPGVDVDGLLAGRPAPRRGRGARAGGAAPCRAAPPVGSYAVEPGRVEHAAPAAAGRRRRPGTAPSPARRRLRAAAARRRGHPRHVHRQHADEARRAQERVDARRAARPPARRGAGPRPRRSPAARSARLARRPRPPRRRGAASRACSSSVRPASSMDALSTPSSRAAVPPASTTRRAAAGRGPAHPRSGRPDPAARAVCGMDSPTGPDAPRRARPPRRPASTRTTTAPASRRLVARAPTWSCCPRPSPATSASPGPTSAPHAEPVDGPFATRGRRAWPTRPRPPSSPGCSSRRRPGPAVQHLGRRGGAARRRTARSTSTTPSATGSPTGSPPAREPVVVDVAGWRWG